MGSHASEGIYASFEQLPLSSFPIRSPHELQNDASFPSQSILKSGLGLTHFPGLQSRHPGHQTQVPNPKPVTADGRVRVNSLPGISSDSPEHESIRAAGNLISRIDLQDGRDSVAAHRSHESKATTQRNPRSVEDRPVPSTENNQTPITSPSVSRGSDSPRKRSLDEADGKTQLNSVERPDSSKRQRTVSPSLPHVPGNSPFNEQSPHLSALANSSTLLSDSRQLSPLIDDLDPALDHELFEGSPPPFDDETAHFDPSQRNPGQEATINNETALDARSSSKPPTTTTCALSLPGNSGKHVWASVQPAISCPAILPQVSLSNSDHLNNNKQSQALTFRSILVGQDDSSPDLVSHRVLEKNGLQKGDLLACENRDVFRAFVAAPKYISPYPRIGGPLGYIPSAPMLHVRCIEVADDVVESRFRKYRQVLHSAKYDRDKYMWAAKEWTFVDPATGKTKEQLLKEEPMFLKRALALKHKKACQAVEEAKLWRNKFKDMEKRYKELLRTSINIAPRYDRPCSNQRGPTLNQRSGYSSLGRPSPTPSNISAKSCPPLSKVPNPTVIDLTKPEEPPPVIKPPIHILSSGRNSAAMDEIQKKSYAWLSSQSSITTTLASIQNPRRNVHVQDNGAGITSRSSSSAASENECFEVREGDVIEDVSGDEFRNMLMQQENENEDELDDDEFERMLMEQLEASN
ncbi:hypothetical protein FQN57_007413 [Myotisia sp. PD_48]|nr:hypothetical protein FQN57_007413 [Myotisia sp. PD_48]